MAFFLSRFCFIFVLACDPTHILVQLSGKEGIDKMETCFSLDLNPMSRLEHL